MKNPFLLLVLIITFISCDNQKRYQGQWTNYFLTDYGYNESRSMVVENDSIKFYYPYFDFLNEYPLKIEKGKFLFKDITLKTSIEKDTLSFNDSIHFVKDNIDTLYGYKPILKIDLPQFENLIKTNKKSDEIVNYIYYGRKVDNSKYSLQLNDKYAGLNEIPTFLSDTRPHLNEELIPFRSTYLFIDKTTPMKYIEEIFYNLKIINELKVCFVNNIDLKHKDSIGLYYEYERLIKKLPPFREHDNYKPKSSANLYTQLPPPPPPYFLNKINKNPEPKLILLKKDIIFFNDEITNLDNLKKIIKPWIKNNKTILSLYDLESTYGSFLELNAIINSVHEEVREEHSKIKFNNKPLKDLSREEMIEIKKQTPILHIWDYSIEHFNHIVEKENSFYGLKVNPIN